MKLRIFQSDKGDCLLLEGSEGGRVLCDGGMAVSMRTHVRQHLASLRGQDKVIDYIYVSHIDDDHISGVRQLLEDELEWRVHDYHMAHHHVEVNVPKAPRPPEIGGIWHNAFRDQVGANAAALENLLVAAAPALLGTSVPELMSIGQAMGSIATSIPDAIKVSHLSSDKLLAIPVNKLPNGNGVSKLLFMRQRPTRFDVGSLRFTLVGPTEDELSKLREGWNNWLRDNPERIKALRIQIQKRIDEFGNGVRSANPYDLRDWNGIPDYQGVTTPNIASLMFMVEEDGKRLLLTGDSHQDMILKGLELAGYLKKGYAHVDVLKVQHHGSEHNLDADFARKVSADKYVFCGNGKHGNPEPVVLDRIYRSRTSSGEERGLTPEAQDDDRPFEFWFSSDSAHQPQNSSACTRMKEVEQLVTEWVQQSAGRLKVFFNQNDYLDLAI